MGLVVLSLFEFGERNVHPSPDPTGSAASDERTVPGAPWGTLEYTMIQLERPDESIPTNAPSPQATRWFFEGLSRVDVQALFDAAELGAEERRLLREESSWQQVSNGCWVVPPRTVVRDMGRPARQRIYAVLRQSPRNVSHFNPVRIPKEDWAEWLAGCGLSPRTREIFCGMTYLDGEQVCFSDCEAMEPECSASEKSHLAKTLSRVPALVVKLRVGPDTDTDALIRYWGRAGRGQVMKPFLDSLTHLPEAEAINISFFFPELMRMKLYTYPSAQTGTLPHREDCFWTSMNFLNQTPDNRFFHGQETWAVLQSEYERIQGGWLFGDVLVLVDPHGQAQHMCVYVAADVVFTKNGVDILQPWVLMRIPDMLARYASRQPLELVGFRKHEHPPKVTSN